ncbi:MAG: hypothetical protein HOF04_04325 [Candidatus Marinimicrobia bacterium]|nr:hypothetical protein [Candidatus Neomarinimicrobiota bacterium]
MIAKSHDEIITWSLDLHLFRKQTTGFPVIMGSNTKKTLATDLDERQLIVFHRQDDPKEILSKLDSKKCFIIGGGKTYSVFAPYLTHLYLTPHPLIFGKGIPLFFELDGNLELNFQTLVEIDPAKGVYQYQYKVRRDIHHTR